MSSTFSNGNSTSSPSTQLKRLNQSTTSLPIYSLNPPPLFSYIDQRLAICYCPFNIKGADFCRSNGIERILNYSGKRLDAPLVDFCISEGMQLQDIDIFDKDFPQSDLPKYFVWLSMCIEDIIAHSNQAFTLVLGSFDNFISALVLACYRRVQLWSIVSTIAEFRQLTWPHKLKDFEQIIELFDPSAVDIVALSPDFHVIHTQAGIEEDDLLERCKVRGTTSNSENDRIDKILHELYFSPRNQLITSEVEFDSSLSLVNDKDDDD